MYKTVTDGDELFTMQPNFGAKLVKDKTSVVLFSSIKFIKLVKQDRCCAITEISHTG